MSVLLSEALGRDDNDAGYAVTLFTAATSLMLVRWSPESVSVNDQTVPLQQPMLNGQVGYWQSPAAMWLVLGSYARGGCTLALNFRGWLTRGHIGGSTTLDQIKHHPDLTSPDFSKPGLGS